MNVVPYWQANEIPFPRSCSPHTDGKAAYLTASDRLRGYFPGRPPGYEGMVTGVLSIINPDTYVLAKGVRPRHGFERRQRDVEKPYAYHHVIR